MYLSVNSTIVPIYKALLKESIHPGTMNQQGPLSTDSSVRLMKGSDEALHRRSGVFVTKMEEMKLIVAIQSMSAHVEKISRCVEKQESQVRVRVIFL